MNIFNTVSTIPCHPKNYGGRRTADQIKYLIFHYTGNDGDHNQQRSLPLGEIVA